MEHAQPQVPPRAKFHQSVKQANGVGPPRNSHGNPLSRFEHAIALDRPPDTFNQVLIVGQAFRPVPPG